MPLRAAIRAVVVVAALVAAPWLAPAEAWAGRSVAGGDEGYLEQLLAEINDRRARAGTAPLALGRDDARDALDTYVADLTQAMLAAGECFHGGGGQTGSVWEYLAASGVPVNGGAEVIGCPNFDGFWTPTRIAEIWWDSPPHRQLLYRDPTVDTVACGTYGPQAGGAAYQTIVCVAYRA